MVKVVYWLLIDLSDDMGGINYVAGNLPPALQYGIN